MRQRGQQRRRNEEITSFERLRSPILTASYVQLNVGGAHALGANGWGALRSFLTLTLIHLGRRSANNPGRVNGRCRDVRGIEEAGAANCSSGEVANLRPMESTHRMQLTASSDGTDDCLDD